MTTQILKRKKINNHLADRKRTRPSKDSAIIKSISDTQTSKRAEEALRSERDKFRGILSAISDGVDIINKNYIIEFQNKLLLEYYGDRVGEKCYSAYMGLEKPCNFCSIQEAIGSGNPRRIELVAPNGKNYELSSSPFKDVDGEVKVIELVRDITERKQAEEALRESEEKYRKILENIADGYYEVDLAGNLTFFNDSVIQLFGYTKEELMGMNDRQYTDRENAQKLYQAFNKVYRTGEPTQVFDWEIIRKDGGKRFIEASVSLLKDSNGQPTGFRGIVRDSTERKCAEEALYIEKKRFQTLSDHAPFGMVMINQDGDFEYINPKFKELFGYDLSDIPDGKTLFRKAYPDPTYRHQVIETWIKDLKSSKPREKRSRVFKAICKDGTEKIVNFISVQLERGEQLMACEDITERRRIEEALREGEERYRTLFEGSKDAVYITSREGKFIDVNPAFLDLFGYSREELNVLLVKDMYANPADRYRFRQEIEQNGFVKDYEVKLRKKDGAEMDCLIIATLRRGNDGTVLGYQGVIRDITERKQAEKEMTNLQDQLRQSQKMEAIGQLAGGIAHDFNNLLTVIKGYSQLSLLDLKESDPLWGNIQEIQKATQRAADLTRQLLAFSRRQILDLKVLDLNTLLRDLNKMLRRIIGEDIELVTLLAEDLGRVRIDPGQFEQMILNLAVNARDAMPSGGKLTIETVNVELDEEYVRTHISVKPGLYVQLSVSDTGVGMSFDTKEKVFEPFFTTKEKGKGTGLGLSTVYGIVKQCEGNIWVYSEPGHGTTFKIYLQRVEEELDAVTKEEESDSLPRGNETVLLVEDDPLVRDLAHRLLIGQGYTVLEASNGEEALRVAKDNTGEKIHLLLTDVVMPQMGGKDLSEKLKRLRPDIEVLYTSGYTDNAIVHHGVLNLGTHFLQKPFSPKTLSHKVREVLDR